MNKRFFLIMSLIAIMAIGMSSCKKTTKEKNTEKKLLGVWIPKKFNNVILVDVPFFEFKEGNAGYSFLRLSDGKDELNWEVKRKQLHIYYKKSPGYDIGYNRHNTRSSMKIQSINDSVVNVIQNFHSGFQTTYKLVKSSMDEIILLENQANGESGKDDDIIIVDDDDNPL